jgi:hypothetical protein
VEKASGNGASEEGSANDPQRRRPITFGPTPTMTTPMDEGDGDELIDKM